VTLAPVHDDATIDEAVAALARELGGYLIAADAGLGSVPLEVRVTRRWREMDSNFQYASTVRWHRAMDLPLPPTVKRRSAGERTFFIPLRSRKLGPGAAAGFDDR
jgi:hypothetical protein